MLKTLQENEHREYVYERNKDILEIRKYKRDEMFTKRRMLPISTDKKDKEVNDCNQK